MFSDIVSKTRVDVTRLRASISPVEFYMAETRGMKPPRAFGWNDAGICPFHDDHKPGSLRYHTETGAFLCHSCGAKGGSVIDFAMLRDGLSFAEAVQVLAADWGVTS